MTESFFWRGELSL